MEILKTIATSKTYLAGIGLILCGVGALLGEASKIQSLAEAGEFAGQIPNHPGSLMILNGLAVFGIGHKVEKTKEEIKKAADL